ncbi:wax ester/triacylglycerol synthase domain-containing protein [Streptomyces sp. NPDC051597]|uniref:wax ester/triacylglycerol synthase domain-containing protein n=1 Tax=Streptomyces sp. NPDC051597 TaxID=3155049 RepID=UPI00342AAF0C
MAVLFTGEPPRLDELRDRVAERWGSVPLLCRTLLRPARHGGVRGHRWFPLDDFDVRTHVLDAHVEGRWGSEGLDDAAFTDLLGRLVSQPVPEGVPPWWLRLVRLEPHPHGEARFALVLSAHHALIDGRSFESLLSRLLDGGAGRTGRVSDTGRPVTRKRQITHLRDALTTDKAAAGAYRLPRLLSPGQALPLPSDAPCPTRDLAWVDLDADTVRAARRALPGLGATLNEVLMAVSAGALRAVHGDPAAWPGARHPLYAVLSVDLRTPQEAEVLGNIVSVVRVPLPVATDGPQERLRVCRALLAASVFGRGAEKSVRVIRAAARLGSWAVRRLSQRANSPSWNPVLCTAIKWRRGAWTLGSAPMERVIPLSSAQGRGRVNLVLTDCAGVFTLCVVGHTPTGYAQPLADAFVRELASLAHIGKPALSVPTRMTGTPYQTTG